MSRRSLHIDRLEIRLRGVSAEAARASVERLGHTLLEELAGRAGARPGAREAVGGEAGAARGAEAGGASELSGVIARKVAASIRARLK